MMLAVICCKSNARLHTEIAHRNSTPAMGRSALDIEVIPPPSVVPTDQILNSVSPHHSTLLIVLGVLSIFLLLILLIIIAWKFLKPADVLNLFRPRKNKGKAAPDFCSGNLRTTSYFDFQTLRKATKDFHTRNLLGTGGFGPVYRGKLDDGRVVAVKRLALGKSRQGESEFLSEVRMITSIQHKNLVRLIGCCSDGNQRLLVYEYLKNRSLDFIVYGNSDIFIDWNTRFQIILGIARGLQYLHEDSHIRIVHRDIKASNILLDDKFQPRIGDFGLARFFPEDEDYLSTTFAGTLGYTAPEYAIRGELSEKADIYSFGVIVLEIISCRKNTDLSLPTEMQYLPEYAWRLHERSRVVDVVDPRLKEHGFVEEDILQTTHVALLCLQSRANLRPPMSKVVAMLTSKTQMVGTPMKPTFVERRIRGEDDVLSWDSLSQPFPSPQLDSPHE